MTDPIRTLTLSTAAQTTGTGRNKSGNWFEAMAEAWGQTLDAKAGEIEAQADKISAGDDRPAAITQLSTLSLQMGFLSNSSHTSLSAVGTALETMARKQ